MISSTILPFSDSITISKSKLQCLILYRNIIIPTQLWFTPRTYKEYIEKRHMVPSSQYDLYLPTEFLQVSVTDSITLYWID